MITVYSRNIQLKNIYYRWFYAVIKKLFSFICAKHYVKKLNSIVYFITDVILMFVLKKDCMFLGNCCLKMLQKASVMLSGSSSKNARRLVAN